MNSDAQILTSGMVRTRSLVVDYLELMKPELTGLSVLTALCGFYLAAGDSFDIWLFLHTLFGTVFVGGGAGALNQYMERTYDALMKRTEKRPLPAGRLFPREVFLFGILISIAGIIELTLFVNPLTGFLAFLTLTSYLFLYTPLKRVTPLATMVGGIPGALPPMMGWTAVRNEITLEAWILFAILFCWQMPHFLSLAWMYRKDYARAGFKMLTVNDVRGVRTSRQIVLFCFALIPMSLLAAVVGLTGYFYVVGALLLGIMFLVFGLLFARSAGRSTNAEIAQSNPFSRRIFFASLLYLPALLFLMTIDKV